MFHLMLKGMCLIMKNLVKYFLDNHEFIVEINKMIKQRDFWMPFAESMRLEGAKDIGYHG
jgi:hypothetical protein